MTQQKDETKKTDVHCDGCGKPQTYSEMIDTMLVNAITGAILTNTPANPNKLDRVVVNGEIMGAVHVVPGDVMTAMLSGLITMSKVMGVKPTSVFDMVAKQMALVETTPHADDHMRSLWRVALKNVTLQLEDEYATRSQNRTRVAAADTQTQKGPAS